MVDGLSDGYVVEKNGVYEGRISIDGVDLSPITATLFKKDNGTFMWLKRKTIMDYDYSTSSFVTRQRKPYWECYLEKSVSEGTTLYVGNFIFLKFRYKITGVWDATFGNEERRINLFVERLPVEQQTILNAINERNKQ